MLIYRQCLKKEGNLKDFLIGSSLMFEQCVHQLHYLLNRRIVETATLLVLNSDFHHQTSRDKKYALDLQVTIISEGVGT